MLGAHLEAHSACDDGGTGGGAGGGSIGHEHLLALLYEVIVASSSLKVAIVLGCFGAFLYLLNALLPRDLDQAAPGRPPRSKLPQARGTNGRSAVSSKAKNAR